MKGKTIFSGVLLALLIAATGIMFRKTPEKRPDQGCSMRVEVPVPEAASKVDRNVLEIALKTPETFQKTEPEKTNFLEQKSAQYADLSGRPALMSEKETQPRGRVASVNTNRPRFMNTFSSLRTDEVRNPDSEQNRAAVQSIMKKRQNRVNQLENRIEL